MNNEAGFAKLPSSIWEFYRAGKISLFDIGVYAYMCQHCRWDEGIYRGTAMTIGAAGTDPRTHRAVQKSLHRLRALKLVNYVKGGSGERGGAYNMALLHGSSEGQVSPLTPD